MRPSGFPSPGADFASGTETTATVRAAVAPASATSPALSAGS